MRCRPEQHATGGVTNDGSQQRWAPKGFGSSFAPPAAFPPQPPSSAMPPRSPHSFSPGV